MSDEKHETIADIVAEMMECADRMEKRGLYDLRECGTDYLRVLAYFIEAAYKREREAGAEKMRENLGEVMHEKYTAQKIREMEAIVASGDIGPMTRENVALMLKQAAEMRDRLDEVIRNVSACDKSSQVGNAAAMREACENIAEYAKTAACHTEDAHLLCYLNQIERWAEAAIAEPPRNCDKFNTADEAYAGFRKFCDVTECSECQFDKNTTTCRLSWLFSEAKGEAK